MCVARLLSAKALYCIAFIIGLLLVFTPHPAAAETIVAGGAITTDTTWAAANSPYVVTGDVVVGTGATLTIEPGVTVKFTGPRYLAIQNGAGFVVAGTAVAPVTITSSAAAPAAGNWQFILFNPGSSGRLDHCTIQYAGYSGHPTFYVDSSDVQVRNCTLASGGGDGLYLRTVGMTPLLENLVIQGHAGAAIRQGHVDMNPTYSNLVFSGNANNAVITLGGTITHSVTLDGAAALNGSPYVVTSDIIVSSGYTLTVKPGTTIRWDGPHYLNVQSDAGLVAEGTAVAPVTITSSAAAPAAGNWQFILFNPGSSGRLDHCTIQYAGYSGHPTFYVDSSDVQVRNCTLASGGGDGLYLRTVGMTPLLENLVIQGHAGAAIRQGHVDMNPTYSNLVFSGNANNAVITLGGTITHSVTLDGAAALNGSPYVVTSDIIVSSGYTLTVKPGTTIRWDGTRYLAVQNGAGFVVAGTAAAPVTITSNSTAPTAGKWQYLYFEPGSSGRLDHCTIQYAGYGVRSAVYLESSDVRLFACAFQNNLAADVTVRGSAKPQIIGNRFANESVLGVRNEQPATPVDARQNWWGHASGPHHAGLNPNGLGAPVGDGILFDPWLAGTTNSPPSAQLQEPAAGTGITHLPMVFRFALQDADTRQAAYARIELLQGGAVAGTFDQRVDVTGWDAAFYSNGQSATFRLPAGLANGAYQWRLWLDDGFGPLLAIDAQPLTVNISGPDLAAAIPDILTARRGVAQTIVLHGVNFAPGVQVSLSRGSENIPLSGLELLSPEQIRFTVDLTDRAGMLTLVLQQGGVQRTLSLPVVPYWPLMALEYHNGDTITPGRSWEHQLELQNLGNAPGVAVVGILPPVGTGPILGAAGTWEGYVGAAPGGRTQVIAVEVNPGETRLVRLLWQLPWANVLSPDQPYTTGKVRIGDGMRFRAMLLGSPSPEGWVAVRDAADDLGDGIEGIVAGAWAASGMPTGAVNQHVETLSDPDLNAYLAAVTRADPWLADAIFSAYLDATHIALMNTTGTGMTGGMFPLDREDVAGAAIAAGAAPAATNVLKHWIDWTIGDSYAFWKSFVTGYRDADTWAQSGAFLVGKVEGSAAGMTFGLWMPKLGADALAHLTGLPTSALTAANVTANLLSLPAGDGTLGVGIQAGGKVVGHGARLVAAPATPLITYAAKYTGRLRPVVGGSEELYRIGFDWLTQDGVSRNMVHWGANGFPNAMGGAHLAIGAYGEVKMLAGGQKTLEAGPHLYADKLYLPHLPVGKADINFTQYQHLWSGPAAVARTGVAGVNAVYPDEPASCNQGAVTVAASYAPNDIRGFPNDAHVRPGQAVRFVIRFENLAAASQAAEDIAITLLVPEQLELTSIVLNGSSHPRRLHTTLDSAARRITWYFDGIQLAPNKTPPEGEGWVEFAAVVREDLATGAAVQLQANIVFDANPPIVTPVLAQIVDVTAPIVDQVAVTAAGIGAIVAFRAVDNAAGSGVAGVAVYASSNGVDWQAVATTGPLNGAPTYSGSLHFTVPSAGVWQLRLAATDKLGNQAPLENLPSAPAQITMATGIYMPAIRR